MRYFPKAVLVGVLSGVMVGTSYIPFPPWALFLGLVPLWGFWSQASNYREIFVSGWIAQFVMHLIGTHWVFFTAREFGGTSIIGGVGTLIVFCTFAGLYYPIAGVLWKWLTRRLKISPGTSFLILPFLFALVEKVYPSLFFWHLGYPWLWFQFPGFQLADWIGFYGLNLITLIINVLLAFAWVHRSQSSLRNRWIVSAIGIFAIVNVLGLWNVKHLPKPDRTARILAIQSNIGNYMKMREQFGDRTIGHTVDRYLDLSQQGLQKHSDVDLLLWPETGFPETIYPKFIGRQRKRVGQFLKEFQVELVTGGYEKKTYQGQDHNVLLLMDGEKIVNSYSKSILLAFGEYIPFAQYFPFIKKRLPMVGDFQPGQGVDALTTQRFMAGPMICYEGLFDSYVAQIAKTRAEIFLNISNDAWYGNMFEPRQHLYMTLARAIEFRRPMVRATNTGITTAILSDGQILTMSPQNQEWFGLFELSYRANPPETFYQNVVNQWPLLLLIAIMILVLFDFWKKKYMSSKDHG